MKNARINNQIRAQELRVISKDGENLGIISAAEALKIAQDSELDLIEISPTANPPVAKIMDYGKFLYQEQKKANEAKKKAHETETKAVQIGIGTSQHDLELKAKKASDFLKEGHRIKVSLILKGRAKYMDRGFIQERVDRILQLITEDYKITDGPKKGPRGIHLIIEKSKKDVKDK